MALSMRVLMPSGRSSQQTPTALAQTLVQQSGSQQTGPLPAQGRST